MKNIKLLPFVLATLVAAPTLVTAQEQTAPLRIARAPKVEMPKARELMDNLFAPYAAAKTFSGSFDVALQGDSSKTKLSQMNVKTRYRFDDKGDLQSEDTTTLFVSADDPHQRSETRVIHSKDINVGMMLDKKVWWEKGEEKMGSQSPLASTLVPIFDAVSQGFKANNVTPIVTCGVEAGRPVFILKVKGTEDFRIVVDQQTRAVRTFDIKGGFAIRGTQQSFDEPMTDESFAWTPPADFKKIEPAEAAALFPEFMRERMDKPAAPAATPTE